MKINVCVSYSLAPLRVDKHPPILKASILITFNENDPVDLESIEFG